MMKQTTALESVLRADGLLLQGIGRNVDILGISNDSRTVKPGDLFICKGYGFKPEYLAKAREAADQLETLTDSKYWPFPVYSDLLFSV